MAFFNRRSLAGKRRLASIRNARSGLLVGLGAAALLNCGGEEEARQRGARDVGGAGGMVSSGGASAGTGASVDGTGAVRDGGGESSSGGDMSFAGMGGGTGGESIAMGGETTGGGGEAASGGAASGGGGLGGAPVPEDCTPATGAPGSGRTLDFQAVRHYPAGGNYAGTQLYFGDLDEDGDLEVITPLTQGGRIAILSGLGAATLSAPTDHVIPGATNVQVFDFDGDDSLDFIAYEGANIVYQAGNGDGTFAPSAIFVPSSGRALPRAADLVGGTDQDLILHAGTSLEIYEGDGTAQYALVHTLPTINRCRCSWPT